MILVSIDQLVPCFFIMHGFVWVWMLKKQGTITSWSNLYLTGTAIHNHCSTFHFQITRNSRRKKHISQIPLAIFCHLFSFILNQLYYIFVVDVNQIIISKTNSIQFWSIIDRRGHQFPCKLAICCELQILHFDEDRGNTALHTQHG